MPLKHLDNDSSNKSALKRKSQSIIVGGAWHIIMVKNHPLGIPLHPYYLFCLSLLEPFNEQIISSRMLCRFWIICLPKTDKARYEGLRPCAKASVRAAYRKIGDSKFCMIQAISFGVKTIKFVSHFSFLVLNISVRQSSSFISDLCHFCTFYEVFPTVNSHWKKLVWFLSYQST